MTEITEQEAVTEDSSGVEGEAKRMGWVPQEEYRGDGSSWVDAETFVDRGKKQLPILRERYKKIDSELAEMKKTFQEFSEYHKKTIEQTSKREYEKAVKDLKTQQRKAVTEGDEEAFDRIEQEIESLEPPKPIKTKPQNQVDPEISTWVTNNQWFERDNEMKQYAINIESFLSQTKPGMSQAQILDEVTKETKNRFPDRFGNPNRTAPSAVYSGGDAPPVKTGKKSFADLPNEAKAACKRFVSQGLLTKEQYIKDYFGE